MQLVKARKKIGPVNHPCDRLIDVISIASLFFFGDVTISRSTEEEIRDHNQLPMPAQKNSFPVVFRLRSDSRLDSVPFQDLRNGAAGKLVSQVG
jgi:hypothetical protein